MLEEASPSNPPVVRGQASNGAKAVNHSFIPTHDRLPTELLDHIFDILRCIDNSKATLFACSLVSPTWRDATLRHRFHSLTFKPQKGLGSSSPYDRLLDFVAKSDAYPHVRPYVRSLVLGTSLFGPTAAPIYPEFARFINHLPSLQSLRLIGLMPGLSSQENAVQAYEPIVPNIRALSVYILTPNVTNGNGWSVPHLCELLRQFGSLDKLWLSTGGASPLEDQVNLRNIDLPKVRVLLLQNVKCRGPMRDLIKQLAGQRPLERLDLPGYSVRVEEVVDILGCLDATPEHVRFGSLTRPIFEEHGVELSWPWDLKCITFGPPLDVELAHVDRESHAGREKLVRFNSSPWEEMIKTLTALGSHSLLERMNVRIIPFELPGSEAMEDKLPLLKYILEELSTAVLPRFEKELLRLHTEGQLRRVAMGVYKHLRLDSVDDFDHYQPCPAVAEYFGLRTLFSGLDAAGILEV